MAGTNPYTTITPHEINGKWEHVSSFQPCKLVWDDATAQSLGPQRVNYLLFSYSLMLTAEHFFLLFVFGSIATCLESERDLSYKCLRGVSSLLLAVFIMKDAKLKALRFSVLS